MMRKVADTEQENMDSVISIFTHVKIKLTKKSANYEGEVLNGLEKNLFSYIITKGGLDDPS
jgi:DNA repair protein RAD51